MLAICVYYDSQLVIRRAQSSVYKGKSRHICRRHYTIKHLFSNEIIFINYVNLKKNIMDLVIKGLLRDIVYNSSRRMDLKVSKDKRV